VFAAYGFVADSAIADITLSFDCTPAVSPSLAEKDPVVRTSIYKNSTLWRVTHIRASGDKVERTDQYRMTDISDSGSLAWQGILFLRPYLKMIGRLSGDRSEYIETLYDARKGGAEIAEFKSLCSATASEQRPQSAETTITPPPAPAPRLLRRNRSDPAPSMLRFSIRRPTQFFGCSTRYRAGAHSCRCSGSAAGYAPLTA
jgi:hypothetical protein